MPVQPSGARPPLFCVHHVGGDVLCYLGLPFHLGADQPVFGLQAYGLDGWSAPLTRVEDMAARYLGEVRRQQPEGPYFLAGFSFGGLVAFEMARQLHTAGQRVALVALLDTAAPGYVKPIVQRATGHWDHFCSQSLRGKLHYLARIPSGLKWRLQRILWRAGRRAFATLGRPLPARLNSVFWSNDLADDMYRPGLYAGRLTLFRAATQSIGTPEDDELGWGEFVTGGVDVFPIPGNHVEIIHGENLVVLASHMRDALKRAQAIE